MTSKLKETREKAGYSIDEIAEHLKIRRQYIIGLEEENYTDIPGGVYVEGYRKMYCDFLKIKIPTQPKTELVETEDEEEKPRFNICKKYILLSSLIMIIILFVIYDFLSNESEVPNEGEDLDQIEQELENDED